jgi:hypothetical protein
MDKFYFGQNSAKRFFSKSLRFKIYTSSKQFEKFYIKTISVPMKKEIFDFYDSGDYKINKSIFLEKMLIPFILIIALFFMYHFLTSRKTEESIDNNNSVVSNDVNESVVDNYDDESEDIQKERIVYFYCNLKTCNMKQTSFTIPLIALNDFIDTYDESILYKEKITNNYSYIAISVDVKLYNDLMRYNIVHKGAKHEKNGYSFNNSFKKL